MAEPDTGTPASPAPAAGGRAPVWRTLLAVAISAVFLYWALKDVGFGDVLKLMGEARVWPIVITVALATSTFFLRIFRWRILLRGPAGEPLAAGPLWHAIAIGFMANNVLPFRTGELLRSLVITRLTPTRLTSALSSIAAERLFDGIAIVLLLAVGLLFSGLPAGATVQGHSLRHIAISAGAVFAAGLVLAAMVVAFPRQAEAVVRRIVPFPRLAERLVAMIEGVAHGLSVLQSPARMLAVLAWSLLIWSVNVLSFYIAFSAFAIPVNFFGAMLLQGILAFAISVPSAPGYVGVFETAIKATLLLYGIGEDRAVTYALVYHATTFLPITLLGAWSLARTGIGLRSLRRTAPA